MAEAADLFRGPAGEIQQRKCLLDLPCQPCHGFRVQHAWRGDAGVPAAPGVVDEAAAHELGKIIAQNRGRAGHATLLKPGPDIGHAEIGSALIQRGQTLVTEQALYIGSLAGGHGNRFVGGFPAGGHGVRQPVLFGPS